ncbi:MAG: hypothetical protein L6R41_006637 [Letrouitia leprolyta]|nr:MAG: hypothetical protein L6R41_006637 [Letrouitia leprolyta]
MAGRFRQLTKAIFGVLGLTTITPQVGINLDPAILAPVEDLIFGYETLPAGIANSTLIKAVENQLTHPSLLMSTQILNEYNLMLLPLILLILYWLFDGNRNGFFTNNSAPMNINDDDIKAPTHALKWRKRKSPNLKRRQSRRPRTSYRWQKIFPRVMARIIYRKQNTDDAMTKFLNKEETNASQLEALQQELQIVTTAKINSEIKIAAQEKELYDAKEDLEKQRKSKSVLQLELDEATQDFKDLQQARAKDILDDDNLKEKNKALEDKNKDLERANGRLDEERAKLLSEKTHAQVKVRHLEQDLQHMKNQVAHQSSELATFRCGTEGTKVANERLMAENKMLETANRTLSNEKAALEQKVQNNETEIQKKDAEHKKQLENRDSQEADAEKARKEEEAQHKQELSEKDQQLDLITMQLTAIQRNLQIVEAEKKQGLAQKQQQLSEVLNELDAANDSLQTMKAENESLAGQIHQLKQQHPSVNSSTPQASGDSNIDSVSTSTTTHNTPQVSLGTDDVVPQQNAASTDVEPRTSPENSSTTASSKFFLDQDHNDTVPSSAEPIQAQSANASEPSHEHQDDSFTPKFDNEAMDVTYPPTTEAQCGNEAIDAAATSSRDEEPMDFQVLDNHNEDLGNFTNLLNDAQSTDIFNLGDIDWAQLGSDLNVLDPQDFIQTLEYFDPSSTQDSFDPGLLAGDFDINQFIYDHEAWLGADNFGILNTGTFDEVVDENAPMELENGSAEELHNPANEQPNHADVMDVGAGGDDAGVDGDNAGMETESVEPRHTDLVRAAPTLATHVVIENGRVKFTGGSPSSQAEGSAALSEVSPPPIETSGTFSIDQAALAVNAGPVTWVQPSKFLADQDPGSQIDSDGEKPAATKQGRKFCDSDAEDITSAGNKHVKTSESVPEPSAPKLDTTGLTEDEAYSRAVEYWDAQINDPKKDMPLIEKGVKLHQEAEEAKKRAEEEARRIISPFSAQKPEPSTASAPSKHQFPFKRIVETGVPSHLPSPIKPGAAPYVPPHGWARLGHVQGPTGMSFPLGPRPNVGDDTLRALATIQTDYSPTNQEYAPKGSNTLQWIGPPKDEGDSSSDEDSKDPPATNAPVPASQGTNTAETKESVDALEPVKDERTRKQKQNQRTRRRQQKKKQLKKMGAFNQDPNSEAGDSQDPDAQSAS